MLARDIMTREVITAYPEEKIEEATRLMVSNKISGIPVVDQNHHVVGVITEQDLMVKASELKVPFYLTLFDSIIFLENPMRFNQDLKKYTASRVKEVMNTKVVIVEEDTPVAEVAELMQHKKINRVPVVRNKKLVGIITRNDILKALVKSNG